jgi:hypothetical protein
MKKTIVLLILTVLVSVNSVFASDTLKVVPTVSADLVSRYVWRGQLLGAYPAIQPTIDFTRGGLSVGTWASYSITPEVSQEVDLYLSYATEYLTFSVLDYYYLSDEVEFSNDYFNWNKDTTSHLVELSATLNSIGNIPISLSANVFVYGDDKKDSTTTNAYSTYFEVGYTKTLGDYELNAFLGVTPFKGYYADKFNLVNLELTLSREIEITDTYSVPVKASFIMDPSKQNVFLVFGMSF